MNKFCSKCGEPIEATDEFCGSCGKPLGKHAHSLDLRKTPVEEPKKEKGPENENTKELPIGSPVKYLRASWSSFASTAGRSRRAEYWYFVLFYFCGSLAIAFAGGFLGALFMLNENVWALPYYGFLLLFVVPYWCVTVRRLHDTGRSGWLMLLAFVPVGSLVLLIFLASDGDKKTNRFGANPKLIA